jgi:cobalt-zinc-cadmium resistance protein CzcA
MMIKGGNSSEVIKRVKDKIADIQKTLPEGVRIVPFLDRTKMVDSAIGTVQRNLMEGALIVIFVLVLLLGNWRAGMIVASVIPLALLFALGMMNLFGVSGNLMSLGAIDFGLIVDGAVIIVEATLHHIVLRNKNQTLSQQEMDDEVFGAASRIRSSAAFGEIIILIVYLPILALSGIEGKMFRPMALTVAFAILGAFILSLTYVPMVSALLLSKKVTHKETFSSRLIARVMRAYEPVLLWSLRHKAVVLGSAVGLLLVGGLLFSRMGGEFIPQLDEGDFAVDTRTLTGSSLSETVEATTKAQQILLNRFPEVEQVVAKIGSGEIPTDPMPIEAADEMVILKPKDQWTSATTRDELAGKMAEALSVIPGVTFGFQQPVQMRFNELMTGARQDVALKIYGEDLTTLEQLANRLAGIVRRTDGAKDLYVEQVVGQPQIIVRLDRAQLARYGLNVSDVNQTINTAFAGQSAGLVFEGEKRYDLVVRLAENRRADIEDVRNLYIAIPAKMGHAQAGPVQAGPVQAGQDHAGQQIPLSQIARVQMEQAPNQIQRDNTHRRITLGFNVRGRDVESIVAELQQRISQQIKFPPGYYVTYGGQFQNLVDAKQRLGIAVPIALALIFTLLFFTFRSVRQSLLIFMAIPMAAIGGVFALLLRGMPFSISAGVGFIALFGVAVLNGIVLIAEFNRLRHEEGLTDMVAIIRQGAEIRLRPVIMTALVASFGFIPMAVSNSAGAEVQKPLATVVIGGLLTATLLTLIILPVLYALLEKGAVDREAQQHRQTPNKTASTLITVVGLLMMSVLSGQAQSLPTVTIDQALQLATSQNAQLQLSGLNVSQQQALRRTAYDAGRLSVVAQLGQYNTRRFDNNLTVTQVIPNPTLMHRLADLNDRTVAVRQAETLVTRNDITYQVKSTYYDLVYLHQKTRLFRQQDTLLTEFVRAATLRVKTGEAGSLEQATAESQLADQRIKLAQNDATQIAARSRLQSLLYRTEPVNIPEQALPRLPLLIPTDSVSLAQNPLLRQLQEQTRVAEQTRVVEQARRKPDFLVGVFSQTLIGNQLIGGQELYFGPSYRFWGGQIGFTVPLLSGASKARIESARVGQELAQKQLQSQQFAIRQQVAQAVAQYQQYRDALAYYEQTGLAQAQLIQTNARRLFSSGDIGYVEFSLAIQQALTIRLTYLDLLNQYNQSVLYINYLAGNA